MSPGTSPSPDPIFKVKPTRVCKCRLLVVMGHPDSDLLRLLASRTVWNLLPNVFKLSFSFLKCWAQGRVTEPDIFSQVGGQSSLLISWMPVQPLVSSHTCPQAQGSLRASLKSAGLREAAFIWEWTRPFPRWTPHLSGQKL